MNWINTHKPHFAALIGAALIVTGILMLLPWKEFSPWVLIVVGCFVLFCTVIHVCAPPSL